MQYECRIFGLIGPRGVGDTCALPTAGRNRLDAADAKRHADRAD